MSPCTPSCRENCTAALRTSCNRLHSYTPSPVSLHFPTILIFFILFPWYFLSLKPSYNEHVNTSHRGRKFVRYAIGQMPGHNPGHETEILLPVFKNVFWVINYKVKYALMWLKSDNYFISHSKWWNVVNLMQQSSELLQYNSKLRKKLSESELDENGTPRPCGFYIPNSGKVR